MSVRFYNGALPKITDRCWDCGSLFKDHLIKVRLSGTREKIVEDREYICQNGIDRAKRVIKESG